MEIPKIMLAGTGEKVQYLAHDFNDNTIRFVLHYTGTVQADVLRDAAAALAGSIDVLHSSFLTNKLSAFWHVNETYEEADFFTLTETKGDPLPIALHASLLPIDPAARVQLHCTLVCGVGECAVALTLSHLCVDGGDGRYLLGKLVEAYNMLLETGSTAHLEVKNGNRTAEQVYEKLTSKEYFSLMKNPISSVKTAFPFSSGDPGELNIVWKTIPKSVMNAARLRAKSQEATANDILLAACYRAYAALPDVNPSEPMSVMSMMDLRRHCKNGESEGLCNMSGTLPTTLNEGTKGDFASVLSSVSEQTRAAKNDPLAGLEGMPLVHGAARTLPLWLVLKIAGRVYGSISIGLTNLGNVPSASLSLGGLIPDNLIFGGPLKKKPAMQISAISFDGTGSLCVVGEYTKEDAVLLQIMLDHMEDEIAAYAAGR